MPELLANILAEHAYDPVSLCYCYCLVLVLADDQT